MKNQKVTIIAGPCSIDENNISEIMQIADIEVQGNKAIYGTRVVGLKSRTSMNWQGEGMGIDFEAVMKNYEILLEGRTSNDFVELPSVNMAIEILGKTNMLIASEIVASSVQMPSYIGKIPAKMFLPWNPAVDQLGWNIHEIAMYVKKHDWNIGLKNGKWIGDDYYKSNSDNYEGQTPLEKTWAGLSDFVGKISGEIIMIHRGVDIPEKGDYRNATVHEIAKRVKIATGNKMYFDPSHSYGPKMREDIVEETLKSLQIKINDTDYLYDGILVEAGTSTTDTQQHITLAELEYLANMVEESRGLVTR
jgi:3-deoxy-D-arabino-heptulosonate 7-phosphate (DAHP) synthase